LSLTMLQHKLECFPLVSFILANPILASKAQAYPNGAPFCSA
jgi:hypothetical protein